MDQPIDDRLQTGFSGKDEFTRLEKRSSTFTPHEGQFEAIDKCRKDIAVVELSAPTRSNLNDDEETSSLRFDLVGADSSTTVNALKRRYQKEEELTVVK